MAAAPARSDTAGTEVSRPLGKLLPTASWDGYTFLAFGDPLLGQAGPAGGNWAMVARWNPAFLGWEGRLAASATLTRGAPRQTQANDKWISYYETGFEEAWLRYPFAPAGWSAAIQAGRFQWRSHSDAALLGEYVTRWNPYPTVLYRPGRSWDALDSLTTLLTGLRFALATPGGFARQELLAVVADEFRDNRITFYWSGAVSPLPGLDLGAATSVYTTNPPGRLVTPAVGNGPYDGRDTSRSRDTIRYVETDGGGDTTYLTFGSWFEKISVQVAADIATLITGHPRPDRGGRLFAEAVLLGRENAGHYYPDRASRIHAAAGLYLPGLGLFDRVRLQADRSPVDRRELFLFEEGPTHIWSAQLFLSRALLPWLDAQAWVLRELGPEERRATRWGAPGAFPHTTNSAAVEPLFLWQARLSARL